MPDNQINDAVNPKPTDADTAVNPQITDAITQTNVKVLGEAPAMAMGSLYQTIADSAAMEAANAVYAQQQASVGSEPAKTEASLETPKE
jgi:killing trait domain-containing protein